MMRLVEAIRIAVAVELRTGIESPAVILLPVGIVESNDPKGGVLYIYEDRWTLGCMDGFRILTDSEAEVIAEWMYHG